MSQSSLLSEHVIELIQQDVPRKKVLAAVYPLGLPQCYVAAGFVRNLVWDHLHGKSIPTPLNDVDVIYFDSNEADDTSYLTYEAQLKRHVPEVNWQVRNQAVMHEKNGDRPYIDVLDAMSYWPEKETAVAVRLLENGELACDSVFGFESLFQLKLTHNPKRDVAVFEQRLRKKQWLRHWPKLQVSLSV